MTLELLYFDVATVNADGRRAEKALVLRGAIVLDPPQRDLGADLGAAKQLLEMREQRLVIRAAIEVQELKRHRDVPLLVPRRRAGGAHAR